MFILQILTNTFLFFTGMFGIILNRTSILLILMCIELMLLSVNLNFIVFSVYLDDFYGQIFSLFILTIAAAESAVVVEGGGTSSYQVSPSDHGHISPEAGEGNAVQC